MRPHLGTITPARRQAGLSALLSGYLVFALGRNVAGAEPDPCDGRTRYSSCFDAEALWIPSGPTPFVALPSARALPAGVLSATLGTSFAHRPIVLVAPSPLPTGREVPVVANTSTLTLAARYGFGAGIDFGLALPFVPYQGGTGADGVTAQRSEGLAAPALRDPRLELGATLIGRDRESRLAAATRLALALPFGASRHLAGYAGPTLAPGFLASFSDGRLTLTADAGLRLRKAVDFGSARLGSEATFGVGAAFDVLRSTRVGLGVALEASLRPKLVSPPPGTHPESLDLPAEWLTSARLSPGAKGPWSFALGAGSGLPLSNAAEAGVPREATLGVTSPSFRAVLVARYTPE